MPQHQKTQESEWKKELHRSFARLQDLLQFLMLDTADAPWKPDLTPEFPFLATRSFAERMEKRNWRDPLLLQVLPLMRERETVSGFTSDPVGDARTRAVPGLIHKYSNRVLLLSSSACAIRCRYCFRREFSFAEKPKSLGEWSCASEYLKMHPEVTEVILSGGDPLMRDNREVGELISAFAGIPGIRSVRLHTRMPVVLPSRVDPELLRILASMREKGISMVMVLQVNHGNEIHEEVKTVLEALRSTGALLFNQAVLLKRVNDSQEAQISLARKLITAGVVPYYLHQLDRMRGAHHFEVPEGEGISMYEAMRAILPGYALPKYVKDVPGQPVKVNMCRLHREMVNF